MRYWKQSSTQRREIVERDSRRLFEKAQRERICRCSKGFMIRSSKKDGWNKVRNLFKLARPFVLREDAAIHLTMHWSKPIFPCPIFVYFLQKFFTQFCETFFALSDFANIISPEFLLWFPLSNFSSVVGKFCIFFHVGQNM